MLMRWYLMRHEDPFSSTPQGLVGALVYAHAGGRLLGVTLVFYFYFYFFILASAPPLTLKVPP